MTEARRHGEPALTRASAHAWHTLSVEETRQTVEVDPGRGLTSSEVERRLERDGYNVLPERSRRSLLAVFVAQLRSPLIYLLMGVAVLSFALGHASDAAVIAVVVLLNAVIGALQEGRAERALDALRRMAVPHARVLREAREVVLPARELVRGDVVLLEAGDAVPADARLMDGAALQVSEAALTGESVPVFKQVEPLASETLLADRTNMLFTGTHVTAGRARVIVVATGLETELGRIAALAERAEPPQTPLERRVAQFGRSVMFASLGVFALIMGAGWLRGIGLSELVMVGISQVVGMVPEGLPVAMTVALAVGVQRMAKRNVVVRRLSAVETLGSTTIICTDKTGTLTRNEMMVSVAITASGRELAISGDGYRPSGEFREHGDLVEPASVPDLRALLEAAALCNDAQLRQTDDVVEPIGDPTEVALLTLARKAGLSPERVRADRPRRAEIPFDSANKMMATQHDTEAGAQILVKGAPEEVVRLLAGDAQERWLEHARRLASRGLRVLAFARAEGALDSGAGFTALRGKLTLIGLLAQVDPPRPEVFEAVKKCRSAGIRPVMVTGDHRETGYAIARELGIAREGDEAIDGRELDTLTDAQLAARLGAIAVFARVHPAQKLRIVAAYQQRGEVVAMTGDGVNDAPALVKANVGVAMGRTGTEVAKEAAKILLGDDNFASIVAGVEEGRIVNRNIKKAVLLLFSTSVAEVSVLLLALLAGLAPPFAAVQILWNNLVTEGLITVNLVMEPGEGDEMQGRASAVDEPLLSRALVSRMASMTAAIVVSTLGWFVWRTHVGVPLAQARTETFTLLAICEWFNVLNCRSRTGSALRLDLFQNPWLLGGLALGNLLQMAVVFWRPLGDIFHTTPIAAEQVVELALVGSLVLWVEELRKWLARRRDATRQVARTLAL
jgi:magnesium-transporting ATPase (P-type)